MKINFENTFITDNSNECENGCMFLQTAQNEKFANNAIANGAKIITHEKACELLNIKKDIKIVAITGTNGKTTTAAAIYSTLLELGFSCALCGTRGSFINDKQISEKTLTTGSAMQILIYLKAASDAKCDYFVMEVSSHAIAQNRIDGLKFALKIFTNLTQDHLDFHGTFEEYARVKSSFFADETPKLINKDDPHIKFNPTNAQTYAIKSPATYYVLAYGVKDSIDALIRTPFGEVKIESDLVGEFNLYNLLSAFAAVKMLTKFDNEKIAFALAKFGGVQGRMQVAARNPLTIVDFAHTPDGIEKVLTALSANEIIAVFGAGGNRDRTKRPIMGHIAQKLAKICVVTSDNPRDENPEEIIGEILGGMQKNERVFVEADRKKAINLAINLAKNGEVIAILGKGDETYQEICGVKYPFCDKDVVEEILTTKEKADEN